MNGVIMVQNQEALASAVQSAERTAKEAVRTAQSALEMAKSAQSGLDLAIKTARWLPADGYDPLSERTAVFAYSVNPNLMIAQGCPTDLSPYGSVIGFSMCEYEVMLYIDVFGKTAVWSTNNNKWEI